VALFERVRWVWQWVGFTGIVFERVRTVGKVGVAVGGVTGIVRTVGGRVLDSGVDVTVSMAMGGV
jgi:hypothetical protein